MLRRLGHKFNAIASYADKIRFPSKLERDCYLKLKQLEKDGKILFFLRQVPFDLPNGSKHNIDFEVFLKDEVKFIEAKGQDLATGKLKRGLVESIFKIPIHVVKAPSEIEGTLFTENQA